MLLQFLENVIQRDVQLQAILISPRANGGAELSHFPRARVGPFAEAAQHLCRERLFGGRSFGFGIGSFSGHS